MKLSVYVLGREIATLESIGDFRSELSYNAQASANDLVSLTMPVRVNSYLWEDVLHPVFQMNLPEGFLLQVLQEQFGPHVSGHPLALLAVVGRNMLGRLQVAAPGAVLNEQPKAVEVADILRGDNSEEAFAELVRQHATSGVSGVVPKFLDAQEEAPGLGPHRKSTFVTHRHIIKGASDKLPYVTLNEYLCMQVAARVMPAAKAQLADDARALVVDRFDVDEHRAGVFWNGGLLFAARIAPRGEIRYDLGKDRQGGSGSRAGSAAVGDIPRTCLHVTSDVRPAKCGLPRQKSGAAVYIARGCSSFSGLRHGQHLCVCGISAQSARNQLHGAQNVDARKVPGAVSNGYLRDSTARAS